MTDAAGCHLDEAPRAASVQKLKSRPLVQVPPPVQLPVVPSLEPGESIQSYLLRCSAVNRTSLWSAAKALGLAKLGNGPKASWKWPSTWTIKPPTDASKELALDEAFLSSFATKCFRFFRGDDEVRRLASREWLRVSGTLLCPECLREEVPYWRTRWRLGPVFACPTHGCLLSVTCPGCSNLHGSGRRDRTIVPAHGAYVGSVTTCLNAAPIGSERARLKLPCGYDLRTVPTVRLPASLISVQEDLLQLMDGESVIQLRGELQTVFEVFEDFRLLCSLIFLGGQPDLAESLGKDLRESWSCYCKRRDQALEAREGQKGSNDHPYAATPDPRDLAVAANYVVPILLASTKREYRDGVRWLASLLNNRSAVVVKQARASSRISDMLSVAFLETTLPSNQVKVLLLNHPLKGMMPNPPRNGLRVTPELIEARLPEICEDVQARHFVLPLQLLVKFFLSETSRVWSDVIPTDCNGAVRSQLMRLVNESGRKGVSRELAKLVIEVASSDRSSNFYYMLAILARKSSLIMSCCHRGRLEERDLYGFVTDTEDS